MNPAIKFIMHGLASGRVRSTPEVLDALKELKCNPQGAAPVNNNAGKPAARECDSAAQADVVEGQSGLGLNQGTHEPHES